MPQITGSYMSQFSGSYMPQISGSYMPQISGSQPHKLKYKTLQISGDFFKFSEGQVSLRNCNTPY